MSFAEKIKSKKNRCYLILHNHRIRGEEFFFLLVDPIKENMFLKMMKGTEPFSLSDYGEIVASGLGKPSAELKAEMKAKYDIEYNDE